MNSTARTINLLVFELGSRRFAIDGSAVQEVVAVVAITPLPKAPPIVEGVINYHGTVVPSLDIRRRFGLPPATIVPDQHLVIARAGDRLVALRVDRATELLPVPMDSIDRDTLSIAGVRHTNGIATLPDGLLVVHDLDRFLSLDEADQLDGALRETDPSRVVAGFV